MLCQRCQMNQATVLYHQIINGEKTEYHLCSQCASQMNMSISFDNMFKGFLDGFVSSISHGEEIMLDSTSCPNCGFTFNDIKTSGKLGCSECYHTFSKRLDSILKNIQANNTHCGKFPKKSGSELRKAHELEDLKAQLKRAIENEEYEEAAHIRDRIKEIDSKNNGE